MLTESKFCLEAMFRQESICRLYPIFVLDKICFMGDTGSESIFWRFQAQPTLFKHPVHKSKTNYTCICLHFSPIYLFCILAHSFCYVDFARWLCSLGRSRVCAVAIGILGNGCLKSHLLFYISHRRLLSRTLDSKTHKMNLYSLKAWILDTKPLSNVGTCRVHT